MADTVTNLKVRFGADTKNFKADLESGKAAVTNFTGAAGGAFEEFASVFGVNMGAVSAQVSGVSKSLGLLSAGMKGASVATGGFSAALRIMKLALISTGVGALIVALGSLISYFTQTERGAEAVERVMASFKAIVSVLIDRFSLLGEGIYKIFTGDFKAGWDALKGSVKDLGTEIAAESKQAWNNQIALQALEDKERALIVVQGKRRQQIAELRLEAKEEGKAATERLSALDKAIALEKVMAADEKAMQQERVRIMTEQFNMGEKRDDADLALQENIAKLNEIEAASLDTIRGMIRERKKLTGEIENEAEAVMKLRLAESKDLKPIKALSIASPELVEFETGKLERSALKINAIFGDVKSTVMDFSAAFNESMNGIAVGFGESLGEMLAGTGTLGDIGKVVLGSLADLAIQVGKIAIGVGLATFGIKAALQSLNPVLAIGAGVALVALGSAAKGALSKAGSGGGGTFSSASTGGYGGGTTNVAPGSFRSQPMTINVTGSFRAQGRDLVAVIDQTNTVKKIST